MTPLSVRHPVRPEGPPVAGGSEDAEGWALCIVAYEPRIASAGIVLRVALLLSALPPCGER
jgi:hypothetical protein